MNKIIALSLLLTAPALAESAYRVDICKSGIPSAHVSVAQAHSSKMFREIGVDLRWHSAKNCPASALRVSLVTGRPAEDHPGALAYALPYEGTTIVVFLDRVESAKEPAVTARLLAHVLAHEVTHILQGTVRHSETGVMKARWGEKDYSYLAWKPLPFTAEDVVLIHAGLDRRTQLAGTQPVANTVN